MFLAGKVEETPRPLKDVILISYEVIHKKDPAAVARIKQKVRYFTEHCLGTSYLVASAILVSQVPTIHKAASFVGSQCILFSGLL
jgi:hypothetical protein